MAQYINKDALVAKIQKRLKFQQTCIETGYRLTGKAEEEIILEYNQLLSFIDTLEVKEVKEVDLKKEAEKYADRITSELYRRSDKHYDKEKKCMTSVLYNVNWSEIGKEMEKCFIEGAKWKTKEE